MLDLINVSINLCLCSTDTEIMIAMLPRTPNRSIAAASGATASLVSFGPLFLPLLSGPNDFNGPPALTVRPHELLPKTDRFGGSLRSGKRNALFLH
jgi:hypothetical protein